MQRPSSLRYAALHCKGRLFCLILKKRLRGCPWQSGSLRNPASGHLTECSSHSILTLPFQESPVNAGDAGEGAGAASVTGHLPRTGQQVKPDKNQERQVSFRKMVSWQCSRRQGCVSFGKGSSVSAGQLEAGRRRRRPGPFWLQDKASVLASFHQDPFRESYRLDSRGRALRWRRSWASVLELTLSSKPRLGAHIRNGYFCRGLLRPVISEHLRHPWSIRAMEKPSRGPAAFGGRPDPRQR